MLVFKGSIKQIIVFHEFWQNAPPKTTLQPPVAEVKALKLLLSIQFVSTLFLRFNESA